MLPPCLGFAGILYCPKSIFAIVPCFYCYELLMAFGTLIYVIDYIDYGFEL